MPCQSCVEKWTDYYLKKGFDNKTALKMANKVVERVEKRLQRERKDSEPMFLLEKAGEGITFYHKKQHRLRGWLYRWSFFTNWKATFFQSFRLKRLIWIGKGFNPDYTQVCNACTQSGSCLPKGDECVVTADCRNTAKCVGSCPAPSDPNSSLVSNTCACSISSGCGCTAKQCASTTWVCATPTGTCGYNCNPPRVWNGSQCVLSTTREDVGDGLSWFTS